MTPSTSSLTTPWIAVDLDGTLAEYDHWRGLEHVGDPIPAMLERVKAWIASGIEVRIFTARACVPEGIRPVQQWLVRQGIGGLTVTNAKDFGMIELWDDRAIQVIPNTGLPVGLLFTDFQQQGATSDAGLEPQNPPDKVS
jgi:hypothetical protein